MVNFLYLGTCFSFAVLLLIIFNSKQRIKSFENKLFKMVMYVGISSIGCEILLQSLVMSFGLDNLLMIIISRLYLVSINLWFVMFSKYVFYIFKPEKEQINYKKKKEQFYKHYAIINVIHNIEIVFFSIMFLVLPMQYYKNGNIMYSYGAAVDFLRSVLIIFMGSWLLISLKNIKKLSNIKYLPIFVVFALLIINVFIQTYDPSVLMFSFTFALLSYLMYFTIENPDVKMINELNIAKERADKANNAKTEFLSSMSHEIRTPLNAIVGFSESLKEEKIPPKAKEEVNDIISASQTLLEIVNGILDISKIEANKLEIINKEYDANQIFKDLINLTNVRIGDKPIELKTNIDPALPEVLYGDRVRVKQVILNVLTNAVKYTEKGSIEFNVNSVKHDDMCSLIISVKDTGRGIKKEDMEKLFAKFERLEEKNTTIEGTGLGLAITKMLLNLMGGNIVVQSEYQKGSNFIISIDQKIVNNPTIKKEEKIEEKEVTNSKAFSNKKILIVDDNKLNLKVAARLLQPYEITLDLVESGDEAIEKIKEKNTYDLILLDDMMPEKSGTETLVELKQIEDFNIPVVVLTANAIEGMKEEYLQKGFDDYLAKPISKEELKRVLLNYLNK